MRIQLQPRYRLLAAVIALSLISSLCAFASADESQRDKLHRIDAKRQELLKQIEQTRQDPLPNRMNRSIELVKLYTDLFMLDYDDPRTRLGAALAMKGVSAEQMINVMFDMVLNRKPTEDELGRCKQHMAKNKKQRKDAIADVVWALCNTKEFVVLTDK
ncbi:MAG: hypothetical protein IH991_11025 [Planctomycetes bacterium]|nr:hypothetical protein [Planctomycetota bacterium]